MYTTRKRFSMPLREFYPLKVSFDKNLFWLTKITCSDIEEIHQYCDANNLEIVEESYNSSRKCFTVQAEKPNQKMRLLRKRVEEIDGWKIIDVSPTKKMNWIIYQKISK